MFHRVCVNGDRHGSGRSRLNINHSLLGVQWRFLRTPDDHPGFSTAWQRKRSLERQANRREKEYQKTIMTNFAKQFNVVGVLAAAESVGGNGSEEGVEDNEKGTGKNSFDEESEQADIHLQSSSASSLVQASPLCAATSVTSERFSRGYILAPIDEKLSIIAALRKGGVKFPLPDGDTRNVEATGEWDGVDMVTAPYLRDSVALSDSKGWPLNSPYAMTRTGLVDVAGTVSSANTKDKKFATNHSGRNTMLLPSRPSTPPALLTYTPHSRVKIAQDVPRELQFIPDSRYHSPRTSRADSKIPTGSHDVVTAVDNGKEPSQAAGTENLRAGLSIEQMSPKRPRAPHPRAKRRLGHSRKTVKKSDEGESRRSPQKPRFHFKSPVTPTFRRSSYGKAWYAPPDLWGVEWSHEGLDLNQEDEKAEGVKQLQAHMEMVKANIPGLFSATRFVTYIRQQGLRLPAHLEGTERAMLAEKAITATAKGAKVPRKDKNAANGSNTIDHDEKEEDTGEDRVTEPSY